ncbi:hypothetical protein IH575_03975 [Candidatus Dojkabacteria bacterium]|nr:hypothetical protein [Candidatus Dojkabacteria bacterium]
MAMQIRNHPTAQTIVGLDSDFTGVVTCATTGTAVSMGAVTNEGGFFVKPHPDNTDTVWVFFQGQTKASGFPLDTGEVMYLPVNALTHVYMDADVDGEKLCYIKA